MSGHPLTDPGDGRTECDVCGKWVYESIHSCKGVPATEAARLRFMERHADNRNPRFADFEALLEPWASAGIAIPGIDCTLGPRVGSEDFEYDPPRCPCGCELTYAEDGFGWLCPHCDGIPDDEPSLR